MTVEEMENNLSSQGSLATHEAEYEEETIDEDEQAYIDVREGIRLLTKAKVLLDFLGDDDMIKTLTKRERKVINRIAETMAAYIEDVYPVYMEEDDEGEE